MPEAAVGTAVEARKLSGGRQGEVTWRPRWMSLYWVNVFPTKVKLWVRVLQSVYFSRLYSSWHDKENHNNTLECQKRNML